MARSQHTNNNNAQQRTRAKPRRAAAGKFLIPTTKQQFRTCLRRMTLRFFNCFFHLADKAMYVLGPILIALATGLIVGLTHVYFRVILPMMAGTNWVVTTDDRIEYWKDRGYHDDDQAEAEAVNGGSSSPIEMMHQNNGSERISRFSSTALALSTPAGIGHTLLLAFFLANIIYNYYRCVTTSNAGPRYDAAARELAEATGFDYPETEEELVRCRKNFEKRIYERAKRRRDEMMMAAADNNARNDAASNAAAPVGTGAAAYNASNGDVESRASPSSPLMATSATTNNAPTTNASTAKKNAPVVLPRIHNWQLLSPIEWGYCRYSSQPKPPRSHYDHVTKALVLNMDHYCPWMFNCIGYFNYRYFFNFLWFVAIALAWGTAICFRAFTRLNGKEYREQVRASGGYRRPLKNPVVRHYRSDPYIPTPDERTPVALGFMMCLCLGAAVACLGGFHLYLALSAQTTIEFHGNFAKRRRKGGSWKNPYSGGSWKKNWEMIYGTRYSGQRSGARYNGCRGCFGMFLAMMPSKREPEFLPLPIDGKLIRRRCNNLVFENDESDEEMDLEMGSEASSSGSESVIAMEETEFLMEPKANDGPLVGRARASRA